MLEQYFNGQEMEKLEKAGSWTLSEWIAFMRPFMTKKRSSFNRSILLPLEPDLRELWSLNPEEERVFADWLMEQIRSSSYGPSARLEMQTKKNVEQTLFYDSLYIKHRGRRKIKLSDKHVQHILELCLHDCMEVYVKANLRRLEILDLYASKLRLERGCEFDFSSLKRLKLKHSALSLYGKEWITLKDCRTDIASSNITSFLDTKSPVQKTGLEFDQGSLSLTSQGDFPIKGHVEMIWLTPSSFRDMNQEITTDFLHFYWQPNCIDNLPRFVPWSIRNSVQFLNYKLSYGNTGNLKKSLRKLKEMVPRIQAYMPNLKGFWLMSNEQKEMQRYCCSSEGIKAMHDDFFEDTGLEIRYQRDF